MPLVCVSWHDAWADHDTTSPHQWQDDCLAETVGFLIRTSPVVSVASERFATTGEYRCVTHIQPKLIEKMTYLSRRRT